MKPKLIGALLFIGLLTGCSVGGEAATKRARVDSSGGTVALGLGSAGAYRAETLSTNGSVGGIIVLQGALADPAAAAGRDSAACGDGASAADKTMNVVPVAHALVWIDGIASGKALPAVRRETLVIEHCRFVPPLIAVATGTTINVLSRDAATHTSRFFREKSSEAIEEIHTVDAGQVVPSEKIAGQAGIVEVRDADRAGLRGYIAVFDHPYFAVTDERGSFRIDSLPPGTYTVRVWRERMTEPGEQRVVVTSGGVGRLELTLTLR